MLSIKLDLTPNTQSKVYEDVLISENAGQLSIDNSQSSINSIIQNVTNITYFLQLSNLQSSFKNFELTGGAPIWAYLSVIQALNDFPVLYSDGRSIQNLPISTSHSLNILSDNELNTEVQIIDLSVKAEDITGNIVTNGLFKGTSATIAGGRVSLNDSQAATLDYLFGNLEITSYQVKITGGMPIWIYLTLAKTLFHHGVIVTYDDGRGSIYSF
jgi:hypothetical protein